AAAEAHRRPRPARVHAPLPRPTGRQGRRQDGGIPPVGQEGRVEAEPVPQEAGRPAGQEAELKGDAMIRKALVVVGLLSAAALAGRARAEKVPLSPEELRETATHVIVGKVAAIYERTETGPQWKYTHYLAEVKVEKAEKGDVKAGDLLYVRYWRKAWVG